METRFVAIVTGVSQGIGEATAIRRLAISPLGDEGSDEQDPFALCPAGQPTNGTLWAR